MNDGIEKLQSMIDESRNIVFFGGAGVSTESGIPDFRSRDGLYNQKYEFPPESIISHTFFAYHTEEFFRFYRDRMLFLDAQPNAAHIFLARLERAGRLRAVVTQNIDGLHQAAGSKNVFELHGSVHRNYCTRCRRFYSAEYIKSTEGHSALRVRRDNKARRGAVRRGAGRSHRPGRRGRDIFGRHADSGRNFARRLSRRGLYRLFPRQASRRRQQNAHPRGRPRRPRRKRRHSRGVRLA